MKNIQRVLTTFAITVLLTAGAATLAGPAHADVRLDLLGGAAYATANGAIHVGVGGVDLLRIPNVLSPVV
ncbi:hypothetical protein [Streptomyces viridochromogenes]|uniref:Secreted protein n=1 Tax=Streptomyces viridochromogenes Tue57 TaxID=1160705 RepID=L8PBU0_STRVR|nr:hypothetical protein [Streptomyces viridochromogenes]ELS55041.1 hypothetical protein STVIR_3943 [Streptomyces viridochromogenes Tue57]